MLVDTLLTFFVIRYGWGYPLWLCLSATGFFFVVDVAFFGATLLKVVDGGWFPLLIGAIVFTVMTTWRQGRSILFAPPARLVRAAQGLPRFAVPGPAAPGSRHGDLPHRDPGGDAARPAAQPEAQQGAARARGVPHRGSHRRALGDVRQARLAAEARPRLLAHERALRLHERARHHARAGGRRRARPGARYHDHLVLPEPRDGGAGRIVEQRDGATGARSCSR